MRWSTTALALISVAAFSSAVTMYSLLRVHPDVSVEQVGIDPLVLVGQIQRLARLETATVPLQTTVRASRGEGLMQKMVGEELVFLAVGEAGAGIDLAKLGPDDLWIDAEGVVWIRLPAPETWRVELNAQASRVINRDVGWVATVDPHLETEVRRAALRQLRKNAADSGIEQAARAQAEVVLVGLLQSLGVEHVRFIPGASV